MSGYKIAKKTRQLAFTSGASLQSLLVGRQISMTICFFIAARMTTLNVDPELNQNIYNVSNGTQEFFNTGLLGAIIISVFGILIWRIIAAVAPLTFLSNPLIYFIVRLCHALEGSGLFSASWIVAYLYRKITCLRTDEMQAVDFSAGDSSNQCCIDVENNIIEVDVTYQPDSPITRNRQRSSHIRSTSLQLQQQGYAYGQNDTSRLFQPPSLKLIL